MKSVNSLSGGKTSSYIAVHYPADYNVFALVRTNDKNCMFPDKKLRQLVSDKIGSEFIATLEMDTIIYTMLDLEQKIGTKIDWVTGLTFEEVVSAPQNNVLPSPIRRYCTAEMKLKPIFEWWQKEINEVVEIRIGFRSNEHKRAANMIKKLNKNGCLEQKYISGKTKNGKRNKWAVAEWQKPTFPLISLENPINKREIEKYWKNETVRFAKLNNCVGCFHRSVPLLKKMWQTHENKMQFFSDLEKNRIYANDTLKATNEITYQKIKDWDLQTELSFDDFDECDSGYCGV